VLLSTLAAPPPVEVEDAQDVELPNDLPVHVPQDRKRQNKRLVVNRRGGVVSLVFHRGKI
jgi:hypothetical protein